jgi:hypothetical protein
MTAGYHAFGGEGFANDYSKMNWANMAATPYDMGNFLGSRAGSWLKEHQGYDKKTDTYDTSKKHSSGLAEDALASLLMASDAGDKALRGVFEGLGKGAADLAGKGLNAMWEGVTGLFEGSPSTNWADLMKDETMRNWVAKMIYRDKNFAQMADGLGLDDQMKSDIKNQALDMRKEEATEYWNKALDPKNMKKVGGNYEIMFGDTKMTFDAGLVECAKSCGGQKINQMLRGMDKQWATTLYDMTLDNDIKSMHVTSIFYDSPKYTGHDTGKSLDITDITFNNGTKAEFKDLNNSMSEPNTVSHVFNWLKDRSEVLDVYTPWQIIRGSGGQREPVPSNWGSYEKSMYTDSTNKEIYRMYTHRHHMHLRLK